MLRVGIIGVGTVGSSVVNILRDNENIITARAGEQIVPVVGVARNIENKQNLGIKLTTDIDEVLNDENIDVIVELMGGVEKPFEVVSKALKNGKSVVTANKALLAYHRYELQESAGDLAFEYEASVAGGIPIINALRDGLSANHILSIRGIMNGTSNYMLTKMISEGVPYDAILKEAQDLGYAEADPTFDVGGFDAAHKLLILASIAYGIDVKPEDILIEGIQNIKKADIEFANEFGYTIKLLAIAKKDGNLVELRVHPVLISTDQMIAKVDGVMNGVSVIGDKVGETMYYGAGAGGNATASAVIANLIDIARAGKRSPMLGFQEPLERGLKLKKRDDIQSKYYLRLSVEDKSGVLAKVATILGDKEISIETMMQKQKGKNASLLLSTHISREADINEAIATIDKQSFVLEPTAMIRIED